MTTQTGQKAVFTAKGDIPIRPLGPESPESDLPAEWGTVPQLLVEAEAITPEQLRYARRVQTKLSTPRPLLSVIRELGYVTETQVQDTLRSNQSALRLGDLLVEFGYLQAEELTKALGIQKNGSDSRRLGEVLVEANLLRAEEVTEILAAQLGFTSIAPNPRTIDRELLAAASLNWYSAHQFLPISTEDGQVTIAFVNPLDPADRDAAEKIFGRNITPAIATQQSIMEAIRALDIDAHAEVPENQSDYDAVGIMDSILNAALEGNASDVHIEPMQNLLRVRFRQDGVMTLHKEFVNALLQPLSTRIKVLAGADVTEKRRHQGGRILHRDPKSGATADVRVSSYVTLHGEKLVLRLLNYQKHLRGLPDLGFPPRTLDRFMEEAVDIPSGVIIVTGPTGSGKTTTLYGAVDYLKSVETSIITAEDPVEYVIDGISQCSINPKLGLTYDETLRHIVRQDPDVIVLGEIRDRLSADAAIQAALTGHKVLTTFHTEDSISGLLRLMTMEIEAFLISSTVVCIVAQRLLRKVCPHCAERYVPTPKDLSRLGCNRRDLAGGAFLKGCGCNKCRYTGYRGRSGVFELLILDEGVKQAILERRTSAEIRGIALESTGLVTLFEDGLLKASKGITSLQEVMRHLPMPTTPRSLQEIRRLVGK